MRFFIRHSYGGHALANDTEIVESKRGGFFISYSKFYHGDKLLLHTTGNSFYKKIKIVHQDLPSEIVIVRQYRLNILIWKDNELYIRSRAFKKPAYLLYKNGLDAGWAHSRQIFSFGERKYDLDVDDDDRETNLYFVLLFMAQLHDPG